jgi:indole-3-glycerol phosphate synthase
LGSILETVASEIRNRAADIGELERAARTTPAAPRFHEALRGGAEVAIIAEIKRGSPSKGALAPELDAAGRARAYAVGGAAALSVLTEASRFGGSLEDLSGARGAGLPMLRKDFITERVQLLEAVVWGASAVLLIARAMPPERLRELHQQARELGLDALVEVRSEHDLDRALAMGATLIGVNNRDLETLAIDTGVSARLVPMIPPAITAVYESGVQSRDDVLRAANLGADGVLVGSALSLSSDPSATVRALRGVARSGRHAS